MSPYVSLVIVTPWPLPSPLTHRYHYFKKKKDAGRFATRLDCDADVKELPEGATLLRPVTLVTFRYRDQYFECRQAFHYEETMQEVAQKWLDHGGYGCDCRRADLIIRNTDQPFEQMMCGNQIQAVAFATTWVCDSSEFALH